MTLQEEEEAYTSREQTPVPQLATTTEEERLTPLGMYTELDRDVVSNIRDTSCWNLFSD